MPNPTSSDIEVGFEVWKWMVLSIVDQMPLPPDGEIPINKNFAEELRAVIAHIDGDDVEFAGVEKALKRIASGDIERGGRIYRDWHKRFQVILPALMDEAINGTRRQRRAARSDRTDALQELIIGMLGDRPDISESELLTALYHHEGRGVIESISDGKIEFATGGKLKDGIAEGARIKDAKVSGLKHRLSRARKKLASRQPARAISQPDLPNRSST